MEKGRAVALAAVLVAAAVIFSVFVLPMVTNACSGTSCQKTGGGKGPVPSGTATLNVWVNFTDGSSKLFTQGAALTVRAGTISLGSKPIQAFTIELVLTLANTTSPRYSGSILVYTCSACGNQQAQIGSLAVAGAVSKTSFPVSSFPSLANTANLTLLFWPDAVTVTSGSTSLVLGMSPVTISNLQVGTTPTVTHTACPSTLPIYAEQGGSLVKIGTATLVPLSQAASIWASYDQAHGEPGASSAPSSNIGLLATYYLDGFTTSNSIVAGLGGPAGYSYGLLSGYHYTDIQGDCSS